MHQSLSAPMVLAVATCLASSGIASADSTATSTFYIENISRSVVLRYEGMALNSGTVQSAVPISSTLGPGERHEFIVTYPGFADYVGSQWFPIYRDATGDAADIKFRAAPSGIKSAHCRFSASAQFSCGPEDGSLNAVVRFDDPTITRDFYVTNNSTSPAIYRGIVGKSGLVQSQPVIGTSLKPGEQHKIVVKYAKGAPDGDRQWYAHYEFLDNSSPEIKFDVTSRGVKRAHCRTDRDAEYRCGPSNGSLNAEVTFTR